MKQWILGVLALVCWAGAGWFGSGIIVQQDSLSLRLTGEDAGVTRPELEQMLEKYYAAAYEEAGQITVMVPETGRKTEAAGVWMAGDSKLIIGKRLIDGSYSWGDPGECMISGAAAADLFGSRMVSGLTVTVDEKEWLVRGIFDSGQSVILLPAGRDLNMTNLEFRFSGSADNQSEAEQACYQYGISGQQKITDYHFFGAIVRLFLWLPFLVMLFFIKKIRRSYQAGGRQVVSYSLETAFWCGIFLFLFRAIRFPSAYIPAKWSDFQFWSEKWREAAEAFELLLTSPMIRAGELRLQLTACSLLSLLSGMLLYRTMTEFWYCTKQIASIRLRLWQKKGGILR